MKTKIMNIFTWTIQILLSGIILMAGLFKLTTPYDEFVEKMPWAEGFSPTIIIIIGVLDILGVIGLNLPFIIKKLTKFVPHAALGIGFSMIGAIVTHVKRGEGFVLPLIIFAMAIFIAYRRKNLLKNNNK